MSFLQCRFLALAVSGSLVGTVSRAVACALMLALIPASISQAVDIDLSGASDSSLIVAPGGSFASIFSGQALSGSTGVSGSPSGPLVLQAATTLDVSSFDPGVSPGGNSILPPPFNMGPLSLLLDSPANSLTWTMGFSNPPSSVNIDFFSNAGSLVHSVNQSLFEGYRIYSVTGIPNFRGVTFRDNNDASGVRYMNFSYELVPEPSSLCLLAGVFLGCVSFVRRRVS